MEEAKPSNLPALIWENRLVATGDDISKLCQKWGIVELSLFGSILRPDFRADSDVDLLITFRPDVQWSLLEWVQIRDEFQTLLGRRVDLVEKKAIRNPFRLRSILDTQRVIYAA